MPELYDGELSPGLLGASELNAYSVLERDSLRLSELSWIL